MYKKLFLIAALLATSVTNAMDVLRSIKNSSVMTVINTIKTTTDLERHYNLITGKDCCWKNNFHGEDCDNQTVPDIYDIYLKAEANKALAAIEAALSNENAPEFVIECDKIKNEIKAFLSYLAIWQVRFSEAFYSLYALRHKGRAKCIDYSLTLDSTIKMYLKDADRQFALFPANSPKEYAIAKYLQQKVLKALSK